MAWTPLNGKGDDLEGCARIYYLLGDGERPVYDLGVT